jgi:hypothetical protein
MEPQGDRLKLKGFIADFLVWDDTIDSFALKFHKKYNVYPNILLTSEATLKKIDLYAQKHPDRISGPDGENIERSANTYTGLDEFSTSEYSLEFCLDYNLAEGYFILVLDEDPDFGGEPVETKSKETENVSQSRKIA